MRFKVVEQAIYIDDENQVLEVFISDPLADSKSALEKLVDFVIERNNKFYGDFTLKREPGVTDTRYTIYKGMSDKIEFTTTNPRHFLSRVEYLRFH